MPARSRARKKALDILYAAEMRGQDPVVTMETAIADGEGPTNPHTEALVRGVTEHRERIDELLTTYAQGWQLDRMPAVDRAILRIGTYELLWRDDVPDAVVISEAVALARDLSTDDSPGFINGLLGRLLELKPTLAI